MPVGSAGGSAHEVLSVLDPNAPFKAASRTRSSDRQPGRSILGM